MAKAKKAKSAKIESEVRKLSQSKRAKGEESDTKGLVTIDRRAAKDRRGKESQRTESNPVAGERRTLERRVKVQRRRQIDPTTCERDYHVEEVEFMSALDQYKRTSGRMFPTCSEVLEVLRSLGYEKRPKVEPAVATPVVETPMVEMPALASMPLSAMDAVI